MPKRLPTHDNPGDASLVSEHIVGEGPGEPIPIDLSFDRVACPRHGEPFRAEWPGGFVVFSLSLFEAFTKQDDVEGGSVQSAINTRPLCELVNAFDLLHAYQAAEIGISGICYICGAERMGTVYTARVSADKIETYPHMCFECVVFRLQPLN